ncbi:MFS transporter [Oscillochloris sp. ZM17-4]|uniref:MFS transporter n=1 Tax=Oscillochloris sp. ZM17-4 TaxID=2866714 RepID=UPI001C7387D3|nr:MFS transporter [Oscillochloris sp. ZM17-4]MBX0331302.1 MFS transporter [Oscillochloris sp. ZM17-4]
MTDLDPKARNRVLGVLFVGVLMAALDIAIVGPALPAMQRAFHVDERALAWVFAIYVLTNKVATPVMAKLSDRFGRRAVYVVDVALFAAGSLIVAAAPSFAVVLLGRAVQGLGAGGIYPVASAVIGDTFPPESRGSALGMVGAVWGIAFLLGPVIGGVLLLFGWQWLFLVNLPIAALVIALSLRLLPTARPPRIPPFDWAGVAVLSVMLGGMAYGLTMIDARDLGASLASLQVWPFLLIAVAMLPTLVRVERRADDPTIDLQLFRSRQVVIVTTLVAVGGIGEAVAVFFPSLFVAAFGVSMTAASLMTLPVVLGMAVSSPLAGRMLDRIGSRAVVVSGGAISAAGMALAGLLPLQVLFFYLAGVLYGMGMSALLGAAPRYIMLNETDAAHRAAGQGLLAIGTAAGQLAGSVVIGAIIASFADTIAGYRAAFIFVSASLALLALIALGLKGRAAESAAAQRA